MQSEDKSRLGSVSSLASSQPEENGEVDYKKLYEAEHATSERLRETLRRTEDELTQVRNAKSPASEVEKRERRAMERKLSEMEEELKVRHMQALIALSLSQRRRERLYSVSLYTCRRHLGTGVAML